MRTLVIIQMLLVLLGCLADEVTDARGNTAITAAAPSAPCADQAADSHCEAGER